MKILISWIVLSLTVFGLTYFLPGVAVSSIFTIIIVGACLTIINLIVKPIIKILTLPINLLTLGLFSLVTNAILFWGLSLFVPGFSLETVFAVIIGSLVVGVVSWILSFRD